jgi:hypothetical protein
VCALALDPGLSFGLRRFRGRSRRMLLVDRVAASAEQSARGVRSFARVG